MEGECALKYEQMDISNLIKENNEIRFIDLFAGIGRNKISI